MPKSLEHLSQCSFDELVTIHREHAWRSNSDQPVRDEPHVHARPAELLKELAAFQTKHGLDHADVDEVAAFQEWDRRRALSRSHGALWDARGES